MMGTYMLTLNVPKDLWLTGLCTFSTALIKLFLKSEKYPIKMKVEKLTKALSSLQKKLLATEDTGFWLFTKRSRNSQQMKSIEGHFPFGAHWALKLVSVRYTTKASLFAEAIHLRKQPERTSLALETEILCIFGVN